MKRISALALAMGLMVGCEQAAPPATTPTGPNPTEMMQKAAEAGHAAADATKEEAAKVGEAVKEEAGKAVEAVKEEAGKATEAVKAEAGKAVDAVKEEAAKAVEGAAKP